MAYQPAGQQAKTMGAFYTAPDVADFLVWWAVRSASDTVLDPSFGGGVFLTSAAQRLRHLGGNPPEQVYGVEVDPQVHADIANQLTSSQQLNRKNLIRSDFLDISPDRIQAVDAVAGNPPFIRFQRLGSDGRSKAAERAREQGVTLSRQASLWAPFLIHSAAMLKPGGRLAMVIPTELTHAGYAQPVIDFLYRSFRAVTLITFQERLFPALSQDVLLLLADGKESGSGVLKLVNLDSVIGLDAMRIKGQLSTEGTVINKANQDMRNFKLLTHGIDQRAIDLYAELKKSPAIAHLGDIAQVGIGYVTGANHFFHISPEQAEVWNLPKTALKPTVYRGSAFRGLKFTHQDWCAAVRQRNAGYLLALSRKETISDSTQHYLATGEADGIHTGYKCRKRTPWYSVPGVTVPDAILTVMSGRHPALVANTMGVVVPNTLHAVRLYEHCTITSTALAALWQTSLSWFSAELEGHALGGGLLKLEPSEARQVLLPYPQTPRDVSEFVHELDTVYRKNGTGVPRNHADTVILQGLLGLSRQDCDLLKDAAAELYVRRKPSMRHQNFKNRNALNLNSELE
jgi:adenine-specific DNA-methyltransferase